MDGMEKTLELGGCSYTIDVYELLTAEFIDIIDDGGIDDRVRANRLARLLFVDYKAMLATLEGSIGRKPMMEDVAALVLAAMQELGKAEGASPKAS